MLLGKLLCKAKVGSALLAARAERWSSGQLLSSAGPPLLLVSFAVLDCIISQNSNSNTKKDSGSLDLMHLLGATIFATLSFVCACRLLLSTSARQMGVQYSLANCVMITCVHLNMSRGSGAVVWQTWYGSYLLPQACNQRLHSTLMHVLSICACPRVLETYGSRFLLLRLLDVVGMFALGLVSVASPLHQCSAVLSALCAAALGVAVGLGARIGYLIYYQAMGLALHLGEQPEERSSGSGSSNSSSRVCMYMLQQLLLLGWLAVPLVSSAAFLGLLTASHEALLLSTASVAVEVIAAIALQYGVLVSTETEERAMLKSSHAMAKGFKLFTQSIGHDLRTPLQALVFANLKSISLLKRMHGESSSGGSGESPLFSSKYGVSAFAFTAAEQQSASAEQSASATDGSATDRDAGGKRHGEEWRQGEEEAAALAKKMLEVQACAELLTCIVDNIWDLQKLTAPPVAGTASGEATAVHVAPLKRKIDLNDSVTSVIAMLKSSPVYNSGVVLRAICDDMIPPCLWGHRSVFIRGLLNLVSNSLKFTDRGHVTVNTSLLSNPDAEMLRVRVDVVDTGHGMSEAETRAVRQPYVQGDFESTISGMGLGLPIVISSIESVGGRFYIESTKEVGTRCAFELDFAAGDPEAPAKRTARRISREAMRGGEERQTSTAAPTSAAPSHAAPSHSAPSHAALGSPRGSEVRTSVAPGSRTALDTHLDTHPRHVAAEKLPSVRSSTRVNRTRTKTVLVVDDVRMVSDTMQHKPFAPMPLPRPSHRSSLNATSPSTATPASSLLLTDPRGRRRDARGVWPPRPHGCRRHRRAGNAQGGCWRARHRSGGHSDARSLW